MPKGLLLGVNVDHVATLRQARGVQYPDPVLAASLAELAGADQITVHLREDRRHIQDRDVKILRQTVQVPLNLEMAATAEMVAIAIEYKPDTVTLVPEKREERTTEGGLDVVGQRQLLGTVVEQLRAAGIVVSLFIDPDPKQVAESAKLGAHTVELHTGDYCEAKSTLMAEQRLELLRAAAEQAHALGLRVVAGHGLHYKNVQEIAKLPHIQELNIGHAIVARAVLVGISQAVREMIDAMRLA